VAVVEDVADAAVGAIGGGLVDRDRGRLGRVDRDAVRSEERRVGKECGCAGGGVRDRASVEVGLAGRVGGRAGDLPAGREAGRAGRAGGVGGEVVAYGDRRGLGFIGVVFRSVAVVEDVADAAVGAIGGGLVDRDRGRLGRVDRDAV